MDFYSHSAFGGIDDVNLPVTIAGIDRPRYDLIGRIGGDEFVVLMKANTNVYKELPTQKISMLKNMLSNIHIQKESQFCDSL